MSMTGPAPRVALTILATVGPDGPGYGYGASVTLTVRPMVSVTVSGRLEVAFKDGSEPLLLDFTPAMVRVEALASASFQASVPQASDPRLRGRTPSSLRALITVRDDAGEETTLSAPFSFTSR
jgi:hypothetical protein